MKIHGIHVNKYLALLPLLVILVVGSLLHFANTMAAPPLDDPTGSGTPLLPSEQEAPKRIGSEQGALLPRAGFVPPSLDLSHLKGTWPGPSRITAQSNWDWRDTGMVSSVKNQGDCGACSYFAGIAHFESRLLVGRAGSWDFSENNVRECNWREVNNYNGGAGCSGINYRDIANMLSKKGTVLESCDPYVPLDVDCNLACPYQKTLLDWRVITGDAVPSTDVLKNYVQTYGPVSTTLYVGEYPSNVGAWRAEFGFYDGSYTLYYTGTQQANHAVLIVGWDDTLTHAGSTPGGWIVKNSWGTDWGTNGFFTIAYGSANIGKYASFIYAWQDYDNNGALMYYDEAGWTSAAGYGSTTAWGLVRFTPTTNTYATRVEFWTTDATTDVDVYIFDDFNPSTHRPSNLLGSRLNNAFDEAGYHSVALAPTLPITQSDDVIVVVKFTNASYTFPFPYDDVGPKETGRTYVSSKGISWTDMASTAYPGNVGIRLRTASSVSPTAPAAPGNLAATVVSQTEINLAWNDNSNDRTGFRIERSLDGSSGWTQVATVGADVTTYSDTGLTCATAYHYRVSAYNAGGASVYSDVVSATTALCKFYLPTILR